ncbi:MAG: trehalose-6-phosphate synthase, partial [Myxococcales bacterium]|nr:trehalose-6-phosphate synthase [Myxococcales bacterium]
MRRTIRFLLVLFAGLALLAAAGYFALAGITRGWFEADMELRSRLAVTSAGRSLDRRWSGDRHELAETLTDIARDERIMAAAACSPEGDLLASTEAYPAIF